MNAGPKASNSKWHGPAPKGLGYTQHEIGVSTQTSSISRSMGIPGETRDLPGQSSASFLTADYGAGRHEAYDSELAQPAYSGHGKVRVGSTSDL